MVINKWDVFHILSQQDCLNKVCINSAQSWPVLVFIYLTLYFYFQNKQCFFFQEFKTGDEVMALWSKTKYPAKILRLLILLLERNSLQTSIFEFEKLDNPIFPFYFPPPWKKYVPP